MLTEEEIKAAAKCADDYPQGFGQKWYWKKPIDKLTDAFDRLKRRGPKNG